MRQVQISVICTCSARYLYSTRLFSDNTIKTKEKNAIRIDNETCLNSLQGHWKQRSVKDMCL